MKTPPTIIEVGPRDGLQNESAMIPVTARIEFVNQLSKTGLRDIEVGAFVSPKSVPQMAASDEVFAGITRETGICYSALVPNLEGWHRAVEAKVDKIAVFTSASETFNRKNINASIKESLERLRPVVEAATAVGTPVRAYVSCAFHCPYEGRVSVEATRSVIQPLLAMGPVEIALGDTVGRASPADISALLEVVRSRIEPERLSLHLHDTYGMAIASALIAYRDYGVIRFDASAGGLGGCPYADGSTGNVATEDLVFAFQADGIETGIDVNRLLSSARALEPLLGRQLESRLSAISKRIE